jgi:8-oxo-dGTP pyrophosphatase MutT (NUDIX family)
MSYLHHIRACNAHDLRGFRPFRSQGRQLGWVRHALAERLRGFSEVFDVRPDGVELLGPPDFERLSATMAEVVDVLVGEGAIPKLRDEPYSVLTHWGEEPLFKLDRVAVPFFGTRSFGIHVNGYVRRGDGLYLWIGRRACDRVIAPGKLDNMIAGGQPHGLSLADNLMKEAKEEAGIDPDFVRRAVPVGVVGYLLEKEQGLKPDTLFVYDLECPEGFVPRNTDGEVEEFTLMPVEEAARIVRESEDFKFNVNLVIIDFLIRHGWLRPEHPEYVELAQGLRRPEGRTGFVSPESPRAP